MTYLSGDGDIFLLNYEMSTAQYLFYLHNRMMGLFYLA